MNLDDLQRAAARCWEHAGHPERAAQRWGDAKSWADAGRCWGKAGRHVDSANAYALAGEALAEARQWLRSPWPERARSAYRRVQAGSATAAEKVEAFLGLGEGAALRHALARSAGAEHLEAARAMARLAASRGRPDVASQIWAGSIDSNVNSGRDLGRFASWNRSLRWERPEALSSPSGWPVGTFKSVVLTSIWEQRIGHTMFGDRVLDWSADGTQFVAALHLDGLGWGQFAGGRIRYECLKRTFIRCVKFVPGGLAVLTGHEGGEVRLFHKDGASEALNPLRMPNNVWDIGFSATGDRVAVSSWTSPGATLKIFRWDSGRPGQLIEDFGEPDGNCRPLCAWSPDGLRLAWSPGAFDQTNQFALLALEGWQEISDSHTSTIRSLSFTPDSRFLITGSDEGTVIVRNARDARPLAPPKRFENGVVVASPHPQAALLIVGEGRCLHLFRLHVGVPQLTRLSKHLMDENVRSLAFSPDGRHLLVMTMRRLHLFRVDLNP